MKKIIISFTLCSAILLSACSSGGDKEVNSSTTSTLKSEMTDSSSSEKESEYSETSTEEPSSSSSVDDIAKLNDSWYKKDSRYATMEPVKKTVENQMEELGIDDPVRARVVNDIQTYLAGLDGTETSATDINQNLEYARTDTFIELRYNGESPTQEMAKLISDDLYSISGNSFSIQ